MYLGKGDMNSKTECMYFPKQDFLKPPQALPPSYSSLSSESGAIVAKTKFKPLSIEKMDKLYENAS